MCIRDRRERERERERENGNKQVQGGNLHDCHCGLDPPTKDLHTCSDSLWRKKERTSKSLVREISLVAVDPDDKHPIDGSAKSSTHSLEVVSDAKKPWIS